MESSFFIPQNGLLPPQTFYLPIFVSLAKLYIVKFDILNTCVPKYIIENIRKLREKVSNAIFNFFEKQ